MAAAKEVGDQVTLTANSKEVNPTASASGWNPFFEMYNSKTWKICQRLYSGRLMIKHSA